MTSHLINKYLLILLILISGFKTTAFATNSQKLLNESIQFENPVNPNDWCWGIESRVKFMKQYRDAMLSSLSKLKIGQQYTYEILEESGQSQAEIYYESKIVRSVDLANHTATLEVVVDRNGIERKRIEKISLKIFTKPQYSPLNPITCEDPYVMFFKYGREDSTVNGQVVNSFYREQFNLGGATIRESVSEAFGLSQTKVVESYGTIPERNSLRTSKTLIKFNSKHIL